MKILVLGGTGFIGRAVVEHLERIQSFDIRLGTRKRNPVTDRFLSVDATDEESLTRAFSDMDVVVNCVTGSGKTIRDNATAVVSAADSANRRIDIVHMSSMSVYGYKHGVFDENTQLSNGGNWYSKAKIFAEDVFGNYAEDKASCTIFRIGCAIGPSSTLWVDRIGRLIQRRRLGDLGHLADGWSNLVNVDDIAKAVKLTVANPETGTRIYNLSAPDSPRWNTYFKDFAKGIGCVPPKYKTPLSMAVETKLLAPPLKAMQRVSNVCSIKALDLPCIPPSLLRLWSQQIKLDSTRVARTLGLEWTPYQEAIREITDYFRKKYGNQ